MASIIIDQTKQASISRAAAAIGRQVQDDFILTMLKHFMLLLLVLLQYELWIAPTGVRELYQLRQTISSQQTENAHLHQRNQVLVAEVRDLKQGLDAIEERARGELGMVADGETFYQVLDAPEAKR